MRILLASSSPYRRMLLTRLHLTFICEPPGVDELPQPQEKPEALVRRLAHAKAQAVAARHQDSLVIGSDQVAALDGAILGKPGNHTRAVAQLSALSGRTLNFYTGLCVMAEHAGLHQEHIDTTRVRFRTLASAEIERYLEAEQPYDCAGSFKSEGLGVSLFEAIESEDPSALVGLPLIALCRFLRIAGVDVP